MEQCQKSAGSLRRPENFSPEGQVPRELLPFLNCRPPILRGKGPILPWGVSIFDHFYFGSCRVGSKNFRRRCRAAILGRLPPPFFFTSGVDQKNFFTQGCTPPLPPSRPPLCPCMYPTKSTNNLDF